MMSILTPGSAQPAAADAGQIADVEIWEQERDAIIRFNQAMRTWSNGLLGGLLFYHRADGPLSKEIERQNSHPAEDNALPITWEWQCLECRIGTDCDATISVRFTDEEVPTLRRYRIISRPGNFWGLHSETKLEHSSVLAAQMKSCRSEMIDSFPDLKF